jgi:uncharacterized protein (DUF362 family)
MNRRDFIKKSFAVGAALGAPFVIGGKKVHAADNNTSNPDLVAVKGGEPAAMFDKGIAALGGMKKFVKKGQTVVVKPNIGWNVTPELAANTNPLLIKRIIEHCLEAGASKVYVFDHTCDNWESTYKNSGIQKAAKDAGALVVPGNSTSYYQNVVVKGGAILKETAVHELILGSDVFINVPVLKSHGGTRLTISMKNLMGIVWDRGFYHYNGLNQCIADFCLFKKPDLNIVDAYTVMTSGGPRGGSIGDLAVMKSLIISPDIVAADAAATKLYGIDPSNVGHIKLAHDKKIGNMNLNELNIKRITI